MTTEQDARTEANFLAIGYVRTAHGRWAPPEDVHPCDNCGAPVTDVEFEDFHQQGPCPEWADPAIPGSTVVDTTFNVEIVSTPRHGFYNRCTARGCTYVSRFTPSKSVARRWANAHDEDQPNDGREQ